MKKAEHYREFEVSAVLRPFIDCIWFGSSVRRSEHFIIPDHTVELIFTTGSIARKRCDGTATARFASHLAGLKTCPQFVTLENHALAAVRFKPGGLYPFIRENMELLIDQSLPLVDVFGTAINRLEEEVLSLLDDDADVENIVILLDRFFCSMLNQATILPLVDELMIAIRRNNGNLSVCDFAQNAGVSVKTLERKFKEKIGLPPKRYAGMYRFHQSVLSIDGPIGKLSDVAYDNGYFDQMHFIREVKRYAQCTPGEILSLKEGLQRPTLNSHRSLAVSI